MECRKQWRWTIWDKNDSGTSLPTQMLDTDGKSVLYGVKEIASGRDHTVLIKEDNTVWSVGWNGAGALGQGITTQYTTVIGQVKRTSRRNRWTKNRKNQ